MGKILTLFFSMRSAAVLSAVAAMLAFSGCATTDSRTLFGGAPIALVSVASNYDINWKGEEPASPSAVSGFLRRALRANEDWVIITKADTLITEAEGIIRNALGQSPHILLASKEEVFGSRAYQEARLNPYQITREMINPPGYRLVYYREKDFFPAFAEETGFEKSLFITLDLTKEMSSGFGKNGSCRGKVAMTMMLKDARGKDLFNKTYNVSSLDETKVTAGAYSQDELLELLRSAISDACLDFLDDLK